MVLKQEELLARYFEHRMSGEEEQNFLIQLAASDDLRTAFRSHLELQKAIRDDKDDLRAVAQVRTRTLTALGLSAAAVTPFIEQELMKSGATRSEPQVASIGPKVTTVGRVARLLRSRAAILTSGLLIGFLGATAIFSPNSIQNTSSSPGTPAVNQNATVNPSPTANQNAPEEARPETIQSPKGLNTTSHSVNSSSSRMERSTGSAATGAGTVLHGTPATTDKDPARTINVTKPSSIKVKAATVSKTPDSTTKE